MSVFKISGLFKVGGSSVCVCVLGGGDQQSEDIVYIK